MRSASVSIAGALIPIASARATDITMIAPRTLKVSTSSDLWIGVGMRSACIAIAGALIPILPARAADITVIATGTLQMTTGPQPRIGVGMCSASVSIAGALIPILPARTTDITMIATRTLQMATLPHRCRILMLVRCAFIIPVCVCACLVSAIGDRTGGHPVMTAIRSTRMEITRLINDRCRIFMRVWRAGIIPTRVCACLPIAIVDSARGYPRMIAVRTSQMPTPPHRCLRIGVFMRCAFIIPVCVCACLPVAIGNSTRGYPCMIPTHGALMSSTGMHRGRRWIRMPVWGAGIIAIRIGAARARAIGNRTRCH